jgi:CheY-like chemotaxis protein
MNGRVSIVLLIEHDAPQRITLARILKAAGYCVIPVARAHEALETFATHHVDIALVVANTQTTTLGGPPLLDSLSTIDPHVPVVVLSAGVAIDRPAYEYSNVAVTLMRPFEPADVLASVDRVVSGAAFNWPPSEDDLADIQVVDTAGWQTPQAKPLAIPPGMPLAVPATMPPTMPPAPPAGPDAIVAIGRPEHTPERTPTMDVVRVEPAPPSQLTICGSRGLARRQWTYGGRLSAKTRRSLSVAATAFCGLALTTLLELRGVPARNAALMDETASDVSGLPLLSASRLHVDAMPLVSARRVRSRATARLINRGPASPAPNAVPRSAVIRSAASRDVPGIETRTAANRARPLPPVVPPRPAAPSPASVASTETIENTAARDTVRASNVSAPSVTPSTTPAVAASVKPAMMPAVTRPGEDERGIYQVLQQYERAYERLDVNAARAVWPSLDARALARAFDGLKAQALEFSHCRVAFELSEATAVCGGSASYVPRVGRQAARTEPRQWTFRLRKVDQDWLIAKAEVR